MHTLADTKIAAAAVAVVHQECVTTLAATDVKGPFDPDQLKEAGIRAWRL